MPKILMVASEATPLAKTGGLAEVVGSLAVALGAQGCEAAIVLPRYRTIPLDGAKRVWDWLPVWLGGTRFDCSIFLLEGEVPVYLVDCLPLYDRVGLYGESVGDYADNHLRFAVFARAALAIARSLYRPDIIHCHDWQAGLAPVYLKKLFSSDPALVAVKTLLTIHNLVYLGLFPPASLAEIGLDGSVYHPDGVEFWGNLSFLKGGIVFADALNTVSPTYAREIQTPAFGVGLDGVLRSRSSVLHGILNGIDDDVWNPQTDPHIAAHYSATDLAGKRVCKRALLAEFGLPEAMIDRPLLGVVSRFTEQKGIDLILELAPQFAAMNVALVALGMPGGGEEHFAAWFRQQAALYPGHIGYRLALDEGLAHRIEAGADMFLMPSRWEPCGLNQMYSMRYGTVPVVRAVGGLNDTVDSDTGFKFPDATATSLLGSVEEAVAAYAVEDRWLSLIEEGMARDFSWKASAARYAALYRNLMVG